MDFCSQIVNHIMLKEIEKPKPVNTILSPLSINILLNMIAAGMSGSSLEQILKFLGSNNIDEINKKSSDILALVDNTGEKGPIVTSINGLWIDRCCQLKASYEELLMRNYNCEANKNCDFANKEAEIRQEINSWADTATRGLITNVLSDKLHPSTICVRANALYFKGRWSTPFNTRYTKAEKFHLLDKTTIQVPFLRRSGGTISYDYGSFDGYKVLRIPYKSGPNASFSMHLFLPDEINGLKNLLEKFNPLPNLDLRRTELDVVLIPKFKFSYGCNLSGPIKNMGLKNLLDCTEMIQNLEDLPPIEWSIIFQKAFIETDEYGTEAAAVSGQMVGFGGSMRKPKPKPKFIADHPFMFIIKEDISGSVFFTGVVLKPEEESDMTQMNQKLQNRKRKHSDSDSDSDDFIVWD